MWIRNPDLGLLLKSLHYLGKKQGVPLTFDALISSRSSPSEKNWFSIVLIDSTGYLILAIVDIPYIDDPEQELKKLKLKKLSQLIPRQSYTIISVEEDALVTYVSTVSKTGDISGNVRVILPGMTACIDCTLDLFPPQVQGCGSALI
jgi:hypothetical protein